MCVYICLFVKVCVCDRDRGERERECDVTLVKARKMKSFNLQRNKGYNNRVHGKDIIIKYMEHSTY